MEALVVIILFVALLAIPVLHLWPELGSRALRAIVDWDASRQRANYDARMTNVMLKMRAVDSETYRRIEAAQRKHSGSG